MYFDKNRLVVFRDDDWFLTIAYPNRDNTKFYFIESGKIIADPTKIGLTHYGRFEDKPIVLVRNAHRKSEVKTFQSVRYLTEADVISLQQKVNRKHYEPVGDYALDKLVVAVDKNDATQTRYVCMPDEEGKLYVISKNKMVDADAMELVGEFEPIYANIAMAHNVRQVCYIGLLTERDVNSLEDKLNNEKIAYSINDHDKDISF